MSSSYNIIVGVSGGIAAYKAVEIVSRLKKAGHNVRVVMTEAATKFVTPLTFREISGHPVSLDMWQEPKNWNVEHIALANWADIFLIAPATANIIGKIAGGIADNLLSTVVMATKAPVIVAPAMNNNMYLNPITQQNLDKLRKHGYRIIEPEKGLLACGVEGIGRLPEPGVIADKVIFELRTKNKLVGMKILVTAGGTREPIDPVRYIGNRSSGKMGYALAAAAANRGAEVTMVAGAVNANIQNPHKVKVIKVETARQMREMVLNLFDDADIVIKAAAVADWRPQHVSEQKIKKGDTAELPVNLTLVKNPDILKELGERKKRQILIGFAAETENLIENAELKLKNKNLDMIVANDVTLSGAGFDSDTNIVKLIYKYGQDCRQEQLPQMTKIALAEIILDKICDIRTNFA